MGKANKERRIIQKTFFRNFSYPPQSTINKTYNVSIDNTLYYLEDNVHHAKNEADFLREITITTSFLIKKVEYKNEIYYSLSHKIMDSKLNSIIIFSSGRWFITKKYENSLLGKIVKEFAYEYTIKKRSRKPVCRDIVEPLTRDQEIRLNQLNGVVE